MKKTHLTITIFLISAILLIVALALIASNKEKEPSTLSNNTIIFYYGITCPHCNITEQYIIDKDIDSKINIIRKEVYENQANAIELQQAAKMCNLPLDEIGVPFMTYNNSCYMSDEDTINLLKQLTGVN